MVERVEPEFATDERTTLVQFLAYYRDTLQLKADGLTDEQAATSSVEPSILTLSGLIRHMAEFERNWFRRCFEGVHTFSDEQVEWFRAGSALNVVRRKVAEAGAR